MSYFATVVKIDNLIKHSKADRLQLSSVLGSQVILDLNAKLGDYYVFFPSDGCIYSQFLIDHKLLREDPVTGEKWSGFFNLDNRVKTVKILDEKSDGFLFPAHQLNDWLSKNNLPLIPLIDGYEFNSIGSIQLCSKYITPATLNSKIKAQNPTKEKKKEKKSNKFFVRHTDTDNFYKWVKTYHSSFFDRIIITEKLHGTSGRFGYFRTPINVPKYLLIFINWLLNWFKLPLYKPYRYDYFLGGRNTNLSLSLTFPGKNSYRQKLIQPLIGKLIPGEMLYFEIVGYNEEGQPLFKQNVEKSKDKSLIKKFGKIINYSYGCEPNDPTKPKNKLFVYRITHTNEDSGKVRDLSWTEIEKRCEELDLDWVPVCTKTHGAAIDDLTKETMVDFENVFCDLFDVESSLDSRHLREGACIRLEKEDGTIKITKIKTFNFKLLEGLIKDNPDTIDEEEVS